MRAPQVVVGLVVLALVSPAVAADADDRGASWPVDGTVVGEFAPPRTPYGAGRRGVTIAAGHDARVRAAASGIVRFAGAVAGVTWVTLAHEGDTSTTYGPLAALRVAAGDRVTRGQALGTLAGGATNLHWGARRNGVYVDPVSLLEPRRAALVGPGSWTATSATVTPYAPWPGARWGGVALHGSPEARAPGYVVPPSPNHAIVIGGIGTDSSAPPMDVTHLGYGAESVTALSYAGRDERDGPVRSGDPWRDQQPYGPEDTWDGVADAAARLAAQLRALRAREPGRAVDLVGHSMGGIVALYYLLRHHDPYDVTLPPIGNVVTIASPHRGSDLADMALGARANPLVGALVTAVLDRVPAGGVSQAQRTPLHMPALGQLATGSSFLDDYGRRWRRAVAAGDAGAFATGTRVLTVGGGSDVVATPGSTAHPTPRVVATGPDDAVATHVVLPGGHHTVMTTEAVREVMWEFLHGDPVDRRAGVATSRLVDELGLVFRVLGRAVALGPTGLARRHRVGGR